MSSLYIMIAMPYDWFRTSSRRQVTTVVGSSPKPGNLFFTILIMEPRFRLGTLRNASSNTARGKQFGIDVFKFSTTCYFLLHLPDRYFQGARALPPGSLYTIGDPFW